MLRLAAILWLLFPTLALGQDLGGYFSPGPLAKGHEHLSGVTQCVRCHTPGAGVGADRCLACHDTVKAQVDQQHGFHQDKGTHCEKCHSDHKGRDFNMIQAVKADFDHSVTGFPIREGHLEVACEDCHADAAKDRFTGADPACSACHDDVHGAAQSSRSTLASCESCHANATWESASIPTAVFEHGDPVHADFAADGAHAELACSTCHPDARFVGIAHEACTDCHTDPHRAPLGQQCESCHKTESWAASRFDHSKTPFALVGMHLQASCSSCHHGHATRPLEHQACADCHADPHEGRFAPQGCDSCHDVFAAGFAVGDFDHGRTGFSLEGGHAGPECEACHKPGTPQSDRRGAQCDDCHTDPHDARFEPTTCDTCHDATGWGSDGFDHGRTGWPLELAHASLTCETCHLGDKFDGLTRDSCADCHLDNPHGPSADPASCEGCHKADSWLQIWFEHLTQTTFSLAPQHLAVGCAQCHGDLVSFAALGTGCLDCHGDRKPAMHYPGSCDSCHAGAHWMPATLGDQPHAVTGFPLKGAHERLQCTDCHTPGRPRGATPGGCADCHQDTDPHRGQLSRDCGSCHQESSWFKVRFRHGQTGWPLRGGHRLAACEDCHAIGFVGTPTECWRCHEADAPPIPPHGSAGGQFCEDCHSPYSFDAASPHKVIP